MLLKLRMAFSSSHSNFNVIPPVCVEMIHILYNIMEDETLTKPISKKATKKIEALSTQEENKLEKILLYKSNIYNTILLLQLYTGMMTLTFSSITVIFKSHPFTYHAYITVSVPLKE